MKTRILFSLLLALLPVGSFAGEKVLARCEATRMVCVREDGEESGSGFFLYRMGKPKDRKEITDMSDLITVHPTNATAVFTKDGKYLLLEGGTGSAGHDFTIYRQVKGLDFKKVKEDAVIVPMQNLALKAESEDRWLLHSYVEFAGWAGPHVMRVKLYGREERIGEYRVGVDGWEGLFDLDTLKARPSPKAKNEGKITREKIEE